MCGSVWLPSNFSEIEMRMQSDDLFAAPSIAPSWNIAPTQQTLTTTSRSRDQEAVSRTRRILVIRLLRAPRLCFAVCEERQCGKRRCYMQLLPR